MDCDHSSSLFVTYINNRQYNQYIRLKDDFYLIFELSPENRKILLNIIQDCLDNEHFCGIVFVINKNEILFDRLFFLRHLVFKLLYSHKKAGVWGVPYCVEQRIFGSYSFSQISLSLIPDNSNKYSKFIPTHQYNSSLMLPCYSCIAVDECDGLGSRIENHFKKGFRTAHTYRKRVRDTLFKTDNETMQKLYDGFCQHVDNSDLKYADRYLYFAKNIDFGSPYSFADRFIYHCDFLPPHEYEKELDFLSTHVRNRDIISLIRKLLKEGEVGRIGYSKAQKSDVSRESFYVDAVDERRSSLLDYFDIKMDIGFPNKLIGVGVDFYNGGVKSYKVYLMYPTEILLQMYPQYFQKIHIDLLNLSEKNHFHTVRLDANKKKVSDRIDVVYNEKDHSVFQPYLDLLPFSNTILKELHFLTFAFEFEDMDISKMNVYYRNKYVQV